MKKTVFIALAFIFTTTQVMADDYSFIEQKREEAARNKMMMLEEIQHKQANPTEFLAKMQAGSMPQAVSFPVASNGHFYVNAMMNGRNVNFIADTGASSIFLTGDDARKIGLNIQDLNYSKVYNTANGQVKAAEVTIPSFKVGPIELANVPISVSSVQGGQSLLGMSFFSRLTKYDVQNSTLTLYK